MKGAALAAGFAAVAFSSSVAAGGTHAGGHHDDAAESIGKPGLAARVNRTFTVDMTDAMHFSPASMKVRHNETVRFIVRNNSKTPHEFVLGTDKELKEHHDLMKRFPGMEHSEPHRVAVAPGKTGEVVWQFTRGGNVSFACLRPGHYDAGMKGVVAVASGRTADSGAHKH